MKIFVENRYASCQGHKKKVPFLDACGPTPTPPRTQFTKTIITSLCTALCQLSISVTGLVSDLNRLLLIYRQLDLVVGLPRSPKSKTSLFDFVQPNPIQIQSKYNRLLAIV